MRKILFTGFEPFVGVPVNPSWEAVRRLPDTVGGVPVVRERLPVVFGEAGARLREVLAAERPDLVVCCGVAAGRTAVTPELVAVNWRMAPASRADNAGHACAGERIDPDGPAARMTDLPVTDLVAAVQAAGIPCSLSLSAGAYVCNDVYWALLEAAEAGGFRGIFVHVPSEEAVSVADDVRALTLLAETAVSSPASSDEKER